MVEVKQVQTLYQDVKHGQLVVSIQWNEIDGAPTRVHVLEALRQFYREFRED